MIFSNLGNKIQRSFLTFCHTFSYLQSCYVLWTIWLILCYFWFETNDFLSEHVIYAKYEKRRIENLNQNQTKLNQSKRKRLMKKQPLLSFINSMVDKEFGVWNCLTAIFKFFSYSLFFLQTSPDLLLFFRVDIKAENPLSCI